MLKSVKQFAAAGVAAVMSMTAGAASAAVFSASDWTGGVNAVEVITERPSVTRFNVTGAGVLQVDSALSGGSAATTRFIGYTGMSYDAATLGAVDSFDYSIDQRRAFGQGHGWALGFKQGSNYFGYNMFSRFRFSAPATNQPNFTNFAEQGIGFDDSFFIGFGGTTGGLDFSASAALIEIGLVIFSGNGGAGSRADVTQYDNFSLTLNQVSAVPVPAALPLLLTGLAGIGLAGYRRKKAA